MEIADKFFMNSFDAQDTIKMCLKFYVQVAEQLEKIDDLDRPKFKEIELGLQKVLNKLELDSGGVSPENMELIALTLRLVIQVETIYSLKYSYTISHDQYYKFLVLVLNTGKAAGLFGAHTTEIED